MATTLADIHPDLIQTHILPLLDGPSLSSTATASSYLKTLCTDDNLWSHVCNSTWPSFTDPRLHDVISTFPAGHRSFFQDSFPALVTDVNRRHVHLSSHPCPSQIISAVDVRYHNHIIYSKVEFTDITDDFLSSPLRIRLNDDPDSKSAPGISQAMNLKVDELASTGEETISYLKESLSLNWILIHPTQRRAGNLSSIKPVSAVQGWRTDDTHLLYATVLPGCDQNKMVQCRIQVVLGVVAGTAGLHVKEVMLELLDLSFCRLKGRDFLVITQGALSGENNVKRKMVDDGECRRRYREFKRISINSLSNLQSEIRNDMVMPCHCFLRKLFHLLRVNIRVTRCLFFLCVTFVGVLLSWLMGMFPSI